MATIIKKSSFSLFEIEKQYQGNFVPMKSRELSDFFAASLRWVGDALRPASSQHFWCDGSFCWFTDAKQNHEQCVFITENGNLMFQDITGGKLYRVEIK